MQIVVNKIKQTDNDQSIKFTFTDDEQNVYHYHADVPLGVDPQTYLDNIADTLLLLLRKKEYPGADLSETAGDTELEKMLAWIAAGHINPDGEVVEKVTWKDTWNPKKVQAETDMPQSVLYNKTNAQIETYLDNNVTDLASVKQALKLLAIEVRNIVRRQEWE